MLMRAVSFFGPRFTDGPAEVSSRTGRTEWPESPSVAMPGGFGKGWSIGDVPGVTRGCRREITDGASGAGPAEGNGVIVGGNRRIGVTGVREGRTIRAVSRFGSFDEEPAASSRGGSAIRTVSFFGSAMSEQCAHQKIAQRYCLCHLQNVAQASCLWGG
jgi:hypothetical protein